MAKIELRNISKIYDGGKPIINDLSLTVNESEFLVLVGPSGCGKSTTLRMIAGLEEVSGGEIKIGEVVVNNLPAGKRDVGMVFQNYALYPHMTVEQNLAFPLKVKKIKKSEIEEQVNQIAELVELKDLLKRYPKQLSGGQRQRVALGRAIVRKPKLFLFDEPLSNLDAKLRTQMRNEIIQLQRKLKVTSIYVTHDQTEAMTMGDRIALMDKGEIVQIGTPDEIYNYPANIFAAEFIGSPQINVINREHFPSFQIEAGLVSNAETIAVRPDDVKIGERGNMAKIINIENLGHEYLYHFQIADKKYISREKNRLNLSIGQSVDITLNLQKILQYDGKGKLIK
jgi:ABC-type sugar transport system ATPase subunit